MVAQFELLFAEFSKNQVKDELSRMWEELSRRWNLFEGSFWSPNAEKGSQENFDGEGPPAHS